MPARASATSHQEKQYHNSKPGQEDGKETTPMGCTEPIIHPPKGYEVVHCGKVAIRDRVWNADELNLVVPLHLGL